MSHDTDFGKADALTARLQQCTEKIAKYRREDYVLNERLVGAHPLFLNATYTHSFKDKSHDQHRQLEKLDVPGYDRIVGILSKYAEESPAWCEWTSETLQEDLSLPITSPPPCKIVQVFMIGVHLSPFVLTCYDDTSMEKEVRQYANQTASALKWRLLEFCHLDFLLLPCIVNKNFDLAALREEIMNMLEDLSECFGGATHLDGNMFQTLKETANALAGLTSLPCLLDPDGPTKIRQHVMEKEWRILLSLLIEKLSKQKLQLGDSATLINSVQLGTEKDSEFKVTVAVIEAVKRLSLRNSFKVTSRDKRLPQALQHLKDVAKKRYDATLDVSINAGEGLSPEAIIVVEKYVDSKPQTVVSVKSVNEDVCIGSVPELESDAMLDDLTGLNVRDRNVPTVQPKLPERGSDVKFVSASSVIDKKKKKKKIAGSKCQFCHVHFSEPALLVPFEHTLEELSEKSEGKTKRKMGAQGKTDARYEFVKVINSFLNAKGGSLLIHTNGNTNVEHFDQRVKDKLVTMIPDDALFQDVYEQRFLDDNHLSFCVKPQSGQRPLSILDFNTKFAVSTGLADPTQGQMRHFMKRVIEEENESFSLLEANRDTLVLNEGKPAMLKGFQSHDYRPLKKNIYTQTKHYDSKTEITEFCWSKSKPYISAFSKLPRGGSVYIGMIEEQSEGIATGRLIVKGIDASKIDQIKIQEELCKRFKTELMHIGRSKPDKPIETEVLPVRSDKSLVVIQIKVNYYHGVCFTSSTGPDLFLAKREKEELLVERIDVGCWLEQFGPHKLHVYGGLATIK